MTRSAAKKLTAFQEDILRTLLYFDIFRHPLTAGEVYRFLPSNSTTPKEVSDACLRPPLAAIIQSGNGYYSLLPNAEHELLLRERVEKEQRARRYLSIAQVMARIIRRFPFVRGICVSGELSKGVASIDGDIDYLLITANDRLWIARTLLILFKKTFLLNSKKYFCLNHFVAERSVASRNRSLYAALEIATLIPLTDYDRYDSYQSANAWIRDYLPNARQNPGDSVVKINGANLLQRTLEFPFRGKLGDKLDEALRGYWKKIWRKRYPQYTEEERESLFQCERDVSTSYAGDFLPKIMSQYRFRLEKFGLQSFSETI